MGMKRKRNELDDSPGSSISTTSSARPPSPSPSPRYTQAIQTVDAQSTLPISSPWHSTTAPTNHFYEPSRPMLNSRTRKRWRDNRPDIDTIHANTLQKLFDAQRQSLDTPAPLEATQLVTLPPQPHAEQHQPQSSLHAYWNLPVPQPTLEESLSHGVPRAMRGGLERTSGGVERCEDCDSPVASDDMMDWNGIGQDGSSHGSCQRCGKRLCDACAIVQNAWLCIQCA